MFGPADTALLKTKNFCFFSRSATFSQTNVLYTVPEMLCDAVRQAHVRLQHSTLSRVSKTASSVWHRCTTLCTVSRQKDCGRCSVCIVRQGHLWPRLTKLRYLRYLAPGKRKGSLSSASLTKAQIPPVSSGRTTIHPSA